MYIYFDQRKKSFVVSDKRPSDVEILITCGISGISMISTGFQSCSDEEITGIFERKNPLNFNEPNLLQTTLVNIQSPSYCIDENNNLIVKWIEHQRGPWNDKKCEYLLIEVPRETILGRIIV
ncbi:MAG: hypothetical protein PHX25_03435 [Candidatus Pacebacteria bacterium]|nr:hypothetical protein [Candidatus Paceibacterota bacterium]